MITTQDLKNNFERKNKKIVFNFKRHPQHDYYIGLKKKFKRCPQFVLYFKSRPQYDYYIGLKIILKEKIKKLCSTSKAVLNMMITTQHLK